MKFGTDTLLSLLLAATFAFCSQTSHATPKAAEHEGAPVTNGADVARPKPSAKQLPANPSKKSVRATKGKSASMTKRPAKAAHGKR